MFNPQTLLDETEEQNRERLQWFHDARYGMFIHWGMVSQVGRCMTPIVTELYPAEEYEPLADTWRPEPGCMEKFAKLAKKAGMRYMVYITKHVDGFSMWDTQFNDYNSAKRGPKRDLVKEFVEAARSEGMHVGLYYPLTDWRHPDGVTCQRDLEARRRFVDFNHGQVRELLSNYGKIDLLWYDCCWPLYDEQMEHVKLNTMVRELQPGIIVNDRSGLKMDYGTPEGHISPLEGRPWEACMTFNDYWGYTPCDTNYKSAWEVTRMLRQVAAGGGNLLLNIGPMPDGTVPGPCESALLEVGEWLEQNGPSIYNATDSVQVTFPMVTGDFTRNGNTVYFHCNRWTGQPDLAIAGIGGKIAKVNYLNGADVKFTHQGERLVFHGLPREAPSKLATVFEIHVEGEVIFDHPPYSCVIDDEEGWKAYWASVDAKG